MPLPAMPQFDNSSAETLDLVLCAMVLIPIVFGALVAVVVSVMPIVEAWQCPT